MQKSAKDKHTESVIYSNVSNAASLYDDSKITNCPRGHGFAAENANHLYDIYHGHDAHIAGHDNAKNGADRIVDGIQIQTKYCSSGSRSVKECFHDGQFRYWNADGTAMQIEVPSDQYDAAISAMKDRIRKGEVGGISDPNEAENIIRKGNFTYEQVKNIAKAGTIESLCYDAASGAIIATSTFGITALITFATSIWSGENSTIALKKATFQGLKLGGVSFATAVLAGQVSKAGLNSFLVGSSDVIVATIGPKASAILVNAFRSGTNIYGAAAMKSASKLLRGNMITAAVSFAVLSISDVANIFRGRISGGQLFKNLATTASSVAGGTAGWVGGATAGAAIGSAIPLIGTAVGGIVGGLLGAFGGGTVANSASKALLDNFIEDDANKMVRIIEEVFTRLASSYLISKKEAERIVNSLRSQITGSTLQDMFCNGAYEDYATCLLQPHFEQVVSQRAFIQLPSEQAMIQSLESVLEDISDSDVS